MSIEISLNKAAFDNLNVKFDENFGLGSHFVMGEEAIFLTDRKNKKQQIIIESKAIAIHPAISTNDKLNLEKRYYIQGAFLSRVLNANYFKGIFLKLFFDIKQNRIKISQIPAAIRNANRGRNDFYKIRNENNS